MPPFRNNFVDNVWGMLEMIIIAYGSIGNTFCKSIVKEPAERSLKLTVQNGMDRSVMYVWRQWCVKWKKKKPQKIGRFFLIVRA